MPLLLGTFVFLDFEIPERMPFGGEQMLAIHRLLGGKRVIDAMGPSDAPISWSGRIRGPLAIIRAQQLNLMRRDGRERILTWGAFIYRVVIRKFEANYENFHEIPYSISVEVVADVVAEAASALAQRLEDAITGDLADALGLAGDSSVLTGIVTGAQAAVFSVASRGSLDFSTLGTAALAGLQGTLAASAASATLVNSAAQSAITPTGLTDALSGDVATMPGAVQSVVSGADTAYRAAGVEDLMERVSDNAEDIAE